MPGGAEANQVRVRIGSFSFLHGERSPADRCRDGLVAGSPVGQDGLVNQDLNPQAAGDEPAAETATDATFDPATFDPEAVPAQDAELAAEVLDFWASRSE